MTRKALLGSAAIALITFAAAGTSPAYAELPVTDPTMDTILGTVQSAVTGAISKMQTQLTGALTDLTNPASVSSLLTAGFSQAANYAKAAVGAQEQIADASNTSNAQYLLKLRDSQMRDEQTASPQQCTAIDSGQVVSAASGRSWITTASIEAITDQRGEGDPGTPAFYGTGQAMQAAAQLHLSRYCSPMDASAGLCTLSNQSEFDERASSLFGTGNLNNVDGVNAANDYGSNLIQPIVPAAIRADQLTSISGEDSATTRRSYNARMSLARSIVSYAIGLETPSVLLTSQEQTEMTNEGLTASTSGSWLQTISLEVNRRIADVGWATGLQTMPPASVQREIATEIALGNYIALQQFRVAMLGTTINATQMAIAEEQQFKQPTEAPSPSMVSN